MNDFEGQIWAIRAEDNVAFVYTVKRLKNKIQAIDGKRQELKLSAEKFLWPHGNRSATMETWTTVLAEIESAVAGFRQQIDISLLWESAAELQLSDIQALSELYFGHEVKPEQVAAVWREIADDRLYFKRKGKEWEARTAEQVEELRLQREREQIRARNLAMVVDWLKKVLKSPLPVPPDEMESEAEPFQPIEVPPELLNPVQRMENWLLRGENDNEVENWVSYVVEGLPLTLREFVFEMLQKTARLSPETDRDIIIAGLKPEFSTAVNEATQMVQYWQPAETQAIIRLAFSIDDEETREVDDALNIERDGNHWKVTIAISDPASIVQRGDLLDREAMRRGTTVYLPTQTVLMLPERISCNIASLTAQQVRPAIVIRAWLNDDGVLLNSNITREAIWVEQRLDYNTADQLLVDGQTETAKQLQQLMVLTRHLQEQRKAEGALSLQRPEYKVSIQDSVVSVTMVDYHSPSRSLVAEMMILANYIAARYAQRHQVPLIYRTQDPPLEPITPELLSTRMGAYRARKLMRPSVLSLQPGSHYGLGLSVYTQLTSPLRRFADLVMQRQLVAHLMNEALPYSQEELFKVLGTAEQTVKESRRVENDAKKRWFIQYLKQSWRDKPIEAIVYDTLKIGYRAEMMPWGVEACLVTSTHVEFGEPVQTVIDKIRIKAGLVRLKLVPRQ